MCVYPIPLDDSYLVVARSKVRFHANYVLFKYGIKWIAHTAHHFQIPKRYNLSINYIHLNIPGGSTSEQHPVRITSPIRARSFALYWS